MSERNDDGFELDENGDVIIPGDFDFGAYYVADLDRLRKKTKTDVLLQACLDVMTSTSITEEQLNTALAVIRDRLRQLNPGCAS